MAESTIDVELAIGIFAEVVLEVEVTWSFNDQGAIDIDDFYAYHVSRDDTGHKTYEKVPYWMHKIIEVELEEYYDDIENKA